MRKKLNLLDENVKLPKILWYIAWPAVLEQTLLTMVSYIDTAMVGSLGNNATSSIGVVSSTIWLINGIFAAIAVGFSVPVGRNLGAGNIEKAKSIAKQSILGIIIFGAGITAVVQVIAPFLPAWLGADPEIRADATAYLSTTSVAYIFTLSANVCSGILRVAGDTRTPLKYNIATNLIKVVLNFFFIFPARGVTVFKHTFEVWGLGLGVRGAAMTTAIAIGFSGTMLFLAMLKKSFVASVSLKGKLRIDPSIWKDMLVLGSPVAADRVIVSAGQIVMTSLVTGLGIVAVTSNTLAVTAEAITYMPAFGLSVAATTLVAQSLGAAKKHLAKKYARACVVSGTIFMTIMGVVLYFSAESLISIFSDNPEVIALGGKILKIEAFAQPANGVAMITTGILNGAKDTKWPLLVSFVGMWCVRIPTAVILLHTTSLGLVCAWIAMVADLTSRGIFSFIIYKRGKWQDKVFNADANAQPKEAEA